MFKMNSSEKIYQENIHNKNLRFLSMRPDGFGVRMIALLNAMYCSKKFHFPFAFSWIGNDYLPFTQNKVNENQLTGMEVGKAEDIFSHDFIQKHYLPDEITQQFVKKYGAWFDGLAYYRNKKISFEKLLYYKPETPLGWVMPCIPLFCCFEDIDAEEYKKTVKECWQEIGLSDKFSEIMGKVDKAVQNKGEFITIHVCSGDVVYHDSYPVYFRKAFVAELAVEIIVRELPLHNVVLMGDDITSLERIIEFSLQTLKEKNIDCHGHFVSLAKDLIEDIYNEIQGVFYDFYVFSKGVKNFHAGSTFSGVSSLVFSNTNNGHLCYKYFSEKEQFDIIKKYCEKLNLHPAQKSFSYWHLLELAKKLDKPFEEQLEYADKMLSLSYSITTKTNYAFYLVKWSRIDLFYNFINSLPLDEIEKIVKCSLILIALDSMTFSSLSPIVRKRFYLALATAEKVHTVHFFSQIIKSFTPEEKRLFRSLGGKLRFKLFYHNLFNMKLRN